MTPLVAPAEAAFSSAAEPATIAAEAEVPVIIPLTLAMPSPGAARKVSVP